MTDQKRRREYPNGFIHGLKWASKYTDEVELADAIDEIERLEADNARLRDERILAAEQKAIAVNDAWKRSREEWIARAPEYADLLAERDELRAEVERLRESLMEVAR